MKKELLFGMVGIFLLTSVPEVPNQHVFDYQGSIIESLLATNLPTDHLDPDHFQAPPTESNVAVTSGWAK
jgi:hypothetical protein